MVRTAPGSALRSVVALLGFFTGVLLGASIVQPSPGRLWSGAVAAALTIELALLLVLAGVWQLADDDRQIEILARATPKRDYYCQSRRGNRLFDLGLSEVGLALCAASAKSDQALITEILAEHDGDGFLSAWLRARDVDWAADLIPDLTNLATESETLPPTVADLGEIELILEEEEITP